MWRLKETVKVIMSKNLFQVQAPRKMAFWQLKSWLKTSTSEANQLLGELLCINLQVFISWDVLSKLAMA